MLKYLIFLVLFINLVKGSGEFTILNSPPGAEFKDPDLQEPQRISETDLVEVCSAILGFSVEHTSSFSGFYIKNPFNLAECVTLINVDGVSSLDGINGKTFELKTNSEDNEVSSLANRIEERYPNRRSIIANINLSNGLNSLKDIGFLKETNEIIQSKNTYKFLKLAIKEDQEFIEEINVLNAITQQIEDGVITSDFEPDFFNINCLGLHAVSDLHGENSSTTNEARQILLDALDRLNSALKKTYSNRVFFAVVTNDASHTRRTREVKPESKETLENPLNRAKTYSGNYPVIFNIILWFSVVMVFTLLAISLAIGNMDPGRDSIIYRMTSTRMKKDN
ncbi:hypothetical protein FQR65_LT08566 [Abscondita terminalis]|nr:hypothetical protein FQR65_LT08566 [Abscondita terminalis]